MTDRNKIWEAHYSEKMGIQFPYPESFVDRLLRSKMPEPALESQSYSGLKLLDLSCGYGRNFHLYKSLGFELYATEISDTLVQVLENKWPDVSFGVGKAHQLPFPDEAFNALVACNSCYYLDEGVNFDDSLSEIARVLTSAGWFLGSIPCNTHSILDNATRLRDGSYLVQNDRLDLRNGYRLYAAKTDDEVLRLLQPHFSNIKVGKIQDHFRGFKRDLFYFTCYKNVGAC